jgi:putative CocE/NonD family hydrolase
MVSMRDGVRLATDVWVPNEEPAPALLVRSPYGKGQMGTFYGFPMAPNFLTILDAGYALVVQDCRGCFGSEGAFYPVVDDAHDGADTIAWLRSQPWCDGRVGMLGASYFGFTQWQAAAQSPDGLMAIAPSTTAADTYAGLWYSGGGALSFQVVFLWSTIMTLLATQRAMAAGTGGVETLQALAGSMAERSPRLDAVPGAQELLFKHCPWYADWLQHPSYDQYWQDIAVNERFESVTVPALNFGGWFDIFIDDTTRTFARMRARAGTEQARAGQRLIIGPWEHGAMPTGAFHDREFGLAADPAAVYTEQHLRFFDRWIRGRTDALDGTAPVRIFVMGLDQWRDEQDWPLPDTTYIDYYLHSAGHANTADGDGTLTTDAPSSEAADSYTYDPADPVPTLGGRVLLPAVLNAVGPVDQRPVETRTDVLCYTTPVLDEPVEVTGHVKLVLYATSTATDTDFTGKLVDVFPDGRAIYLTDGILRTRYRHSLAEPELLDPDQVHELTLDLSVTSNVFLPGHRIRLDVSSSCFPRYDRNTNTGGSINQETLDDAVTATNGILHGPAHPSRLVLPIIRR